MVTTHGVEGIGNVEAGDPVDAEGDGIVDVAEDFVDAGTDSILLRE
jgi:hypothetical protein